MSNPAEPQERVYCLSLNSVYLIMVYYVVLFIIGLFLFAMTVYFEYFKIDAIPNTALAIIGGSSASILGSTIYYIRKLYLICIHNSFMNADECRGTRKFGTIIYFVIRPWFAVVICVLIILGISVGIFAFFITDGTLSPTFVDFVMVIAFFLGISNGQLNDKVGKVGQSFISKLLD